MTLRAAWCELTERLGFADDWWSDAERYYGVSRREAIRLGTRAPGRRPSLPGSRTCAPVSGKTWDELWSARPRTTAAEIASFYQEVGSWCVFRQLVRHRGRGFQEVSDRTPRSGTVLEYGCGIAPVSWWLASRRPDTHIALVDIPSEPLEFARWRLDKMHRGWWCGLITNDNAIPITPCHVAVCLEVLEHVPSPIIAMRSILAALKSGGWLYEDFRSHDGDGSPADLESAAMERDAMYRIVRRECRLVEGDVPEAPDGGNRRWWQKR